MATTTPNYAWVVPTSSDLVKNGATAIETLGDSVDASLWNSGYGQASKNKIINGDFGINQRSFSSTTTSADYNFDRWRTIYTGGTSTTTPQVFTPGTAPVAGYEGKNYYRVAITGQSAVTDFVRVQEQIESVRTLAGQTATISFWAKASAGTPKIAVNMVQTFGTGGSPSAGVDVLSGTVTTSTAWARYSVSVAIPSISGKTLGTANDDALSLRLMLSGGSSVSAAQSIGLQNVTFDIWGVQVEYGSYATPFQTASGGSQQGELAMCQRYYVRLGAANGLTTAAYATYGNGYTTSTTNATIPVQLPVTMRVAPTSVDYSNLAIINTSSTLIAVSAVAINSSNNSNNRAHVEATVTGATANVYQTLENNNSTSGYIGFSAEL